MMNKHLEEFGIAQYFLSTILSLGKLVDSLPSASNTKALEGPDRVAGPATLHGK